MKNSKLRRALLLFACAVLLVCLSVGATLAYLTSTTDVVENTFTVGNVTLDDPDTEENEGLDEAKVNEYGEPVDANNNVVADNEELDPEEWADAPRVQENEYKLIANHTYVKDPTVHVQAGSEPCYVRMIVTISHINELEAITGDPFMPFKVVKGWSNDVWQYQGNAVINNVGYYEFWFVATDTSDAKLYTNGVVDARYIAENTAVDLPALFTHIWVPGNATNEQLEALEDLEINVIAQAVQKDGFDTQAAAWEKVERPANFQFTPVL